MSSNVQVGAWRRVATGLVGLPPHAAPMALFAELMPIWADARHTMPLAVMDFDGCWAPVSEWITDAAIKRALLDFVGGQSYDDFDGGGSVDEAAIHRARRILLGLDPEPPADVAEVRAIDGA